MYVSEHGRFRALAYAAEETAIVTGGRGGKLTVSNWSGDDDDDGLPRFAVRISIVPLFPSERKFRFPLRISAIQAIENGAIS